MADPCDIFLSYSREDQAVAHRFAEAFEREGFSVWWDATLRSGDAWDAVTEEALAGAKAVVVLWSTTSVASRWVRAEATQADRDGKLVPVMIGPCKRPIMFELRQTAELGHWKGDRRDDEWVALVEDVRRVAVREPGAVPSGGMAPQPPRRSPMAAAKRLRAWKLATAALGLLAVVLLAGLAALALHRPSATQGSAARLVQFAVPAPDGTHFVNSLNAGNSAPVGGSLSPDGRMLAFTAKTESGAAMLWVRPLDSTEARMLPGTEDAALPFWSPDSRSIGFFTAGRLRRIAVDGGAPVDLCAVYRGQGGSWNRDGVIIFSPALRSGLMRVSAEGGEPVPLLALSDEHRAYRYPQFLPDGRHYVYYAEGARPEDWGVYVASLGEDAGRKLLEADSTAVPASPDHLLFVRQGRLFAQRFDFARLGLLDEPVRIAQSVPFEGAAPAFSASANGLLSYRSGPADTDQQQFSWFDREGKLLGTVGRPADYRGMELSPDGTRIAVHPHEGTRGDIWVIEPRGTATRITFDPAQDNSGPTWSPDGSRIAFSSLRDGKWGIWTTSANGDGQEKLVYESDLPLTLNSWSPDGRYLVFLEPDERIGPLPRVLPTGGGEPQALFDARTIANHVQVSPDGRWVSYISYASGRGEVYVRAFPSGEGVVQVSTAGAVTPRWRSDGREIYYWTSYDHGKLVAVPVDGTGTTFKAGAPQELFGVDLALVPHSTAIQTYHTYDVSPDGRRFVIPVPTAELAGDRSATPITVVLNWTAGISQGSTEK